MRRDGEVALQEEEEEVHDGDHAAGLLVLVDADQRGRVALGEHEEEAGERLVGAHRQLRAEGLELRRSRRERRTLEMNVLMG